LKRDGECDDRKVVYERFHHWPSDSLIGAIVDVRSYLLGVGLVGFEHRDVIRSLNDPLYWLERPPIPMDYFKDLLPGVSASLPLLCKTFFMLEERKRTRFADGVSVASVGIGWTVPAYMIVTDYKNGLLDVAFHCAATDAESLIASRKASYIQRPWTPEGLHAVILEARSWFARMDLDRCERCASAEPPRRKVSLACVGMCAGCVIAAELGHRD
jgi:hypothetical protein